MALASKGVAKGAQTRDRTLTVPHLMSVGTPESFSWGCFLNTFSGSLQLCTRVCVCVHVCVCVGGGEHVYLFVSKY